MTRHCSTASQQVQLYLSLALSFVLLLSLSFGSSNTEVNASPATSSRSSISLFSAGKRSSTSTRRPLVSIGLLNSRMVALFEDGDSISSDDQSTIDQMIVYDMDTLAFTSADKANSVVLLYGGQPLPQAWPALSSVFQEQMIPKGHLMTISDDDLQEYLFVGVSSKSVLFNLQSKKVVSEQVSFSVASGTQLVSSKSAKTFYDFKLSDGGVYSYTKYTVQGKMASGGGSFWTKDTSSSMCIIKKDSTGDYVVRDGSKGSCSQSSGSSSKIEWSLWGGGFSDGTHFHLFTEEQVMIVPMDYGTGSNGTGEGDGAPVKVIKMEDYFGDASLYLRGLAFIKVHLLAVIIVGLGIFALLICLALFLWCYCSKNGEQKMEPYDGDSRSAGGGSHDHEKSDGHHHHPQDHHDHKQQHSGATAVASPHGQKSKSQPHGQKSKSQPQGHQHKASQSKPNPNAIISKAVEKSKVKEKGKVVSTTHPKSNPRSKNRSSCSGVSHRNQQKTVLGNSVVGGQHASSAAPVSVRSTSLAKGKVSKSKIRLKVKPKSRNNNNINVNKALASKISSSSVFGVAASKVKKNHCDNKKKKKKKHSKTYSKRGGGESSSRDSRKRSSSSSSSKSDSKYHSHSRKKRSNSTKKHGSKGRDAQGHGHRRRHHSPADQQKPKAKDLTLVNFKFMSSHTAIHRPVRD